MVDFCKKNLRFLSFCVINLLLWGIYIVLASNLHPMSWCASKSSSLFLTLAYFHLSYYPLWINISFLDPLSELISSQIYSISKFSELGALGIVCYLLRSSLLFSFVGTQYWLFCSLYRHIVPAVSVSLCVPNVPGDNTFILDNIGMEIIKWLGSTQAENMTGNTSIFQISP
jgi:hypothetical protein